ncbi:hypothetical protein PoB_006823500 [Plakobranchus ocellatus]|uniref:L1 transposable element RRM domain-containing protein n=1 Tax=Plakobranchus ocellatus TaxID=259542 RepID=A0AAV4DCQ8_9GAST|nr:hypothetical protein PoB_006823500 [Plakobranchus ocellatus]
MGGSKRKKQTTFSDESTHCAHSNDEVFIKLRTLEYKLETLSNNNTQRLIDNIEIIQGTLHDLLIEQDNIKKDIRDLKDQRSIRTDEVSSLRQTINELGLKVNELEQYGRRANVRFFGLRDKIDETNAATVKTVTEIIRTKLNWREFNPSQIDVAHRIGPYRNNADRSVIVRFCSHTIATEVKRRRRNLKGTNIVLTEDLTPITLEKYKRLKSLPEIKQAWTKEGEIFVKNFKDTVFKMAKGEGVEDLRHRLNKPQPTPSNMKYAQEKMNHPMQAQELQTARQQARSNSNSRRADVETTDQPTKEGAKEARDVTSHIDTEDSQNIPLTSTPVGHSTKSSQEKNNKQRNQRTMHPWLDKSKK